MSLKPDLPNLPRQASSHASGGLAALLDEHTSEGVLWRTEGDRIRCFACGHRCLIGEGRRGICKVRFNTGGRLRVPFGYVSGVQCDPVEKKPFFHVHPGADALTFGMLGCDFHCSYCQNWVTSQALRDPASSGQIQLATPEELVGAGERFGADLVVSSYNEPLITAEWAVSVFRKAHERGLLCAFVSNGNATGEALDYLRPWLAAYKVDLKSFDDRQYRKLGGTLDQVKKTIQMVYERGLWLEVLTLLVPGFNDGQEELRNLTRFVAGVSRDIPWHVTAFHQNYRMTEPRNTTARDLVRACEIGTEEGLRFVYAGNMPGRVGEWENTRCPRCSSTLIERQGYVIRRNDVGRTGACPNCGQFIPGVWGETADNGTARGTSSWWSRLPRPVRLGQRPGSADR